MSHQGCWFAGAVVLVALAGAAVTAQAPPIGDPTPAEVLKRNGVEPTLAGVREYLRPWRGQEQERARIAGLIARLGSESFREREEAERGLAAAGAAALGPLRQAAGSDDAEVARRAGRLLREIEKGQAGRLDDEVLGAALTWLGQSGAKESAGLLLEVLPHLPGAGPREQAARALAGCAGPADRARLEGAVRAGPAVVRAAALVALERAAGEGAVPAVESCLRDGDEGVRLAAARALLERRPRAAVAVLLELARTGEPDVGARAGWLLQQASGLPAPGGPVPELGQAVKLWQAWAERSGAVAALGARRLEAGRYGLLVSVRFTQDAADVSGGYGRLRHETDCSGKASVARGLLRLDGQHPEGDQRLVAEAEKVLGRPEFPARFQVRATLGGEDGEAGAWHVGVSVGNVRVLFHPGLEGGAFRVERVKDHFYLTTNEDMGFTPSGGVLQEMAVGVARREDGSAVLDVEVREGGKGKGVFRKRVTVKAEDLGPVGRVGLERSGRTGGAALFGSLAIRQ